MCPCCTLKIHTCFFFPSENVCMYLWNRVCACPRAHVEARGHLAERVLSLAAGFHLGRICICKPLYPLNHLAALLSLCPLDEETQLCESCCCLLNVPLFPLSIGGREKASPHPCLTLRWCQEADETDAHSGERHEVCLCLQRALTPLPLCFSPFSPPLRCP